MAGYNRGIVATRKLNKENKARLGRGGDTKIRKVDGKDSHVNALEAYLIDVNHKAGEEYTKRVGSGDTNPLTGMPEYQTGEKTYEELAAMSPYEYEMYLAGQGVAGQMTTYTKIGGTVLGEETSEGTRKFMGDLSDIQDDPSLKYIQQQKELVTGQAADYLGRGGFKGTAATTRDLALGELGAARGLTEKQLALESTQAGQSLGQAQQFAMAGAGAQYQTQTAGLASGLASGQRAAGRGLAQARAGAQSTAGKAGFVRGPAEAAFESQRGDVMAGSRELSKQYQTGRAQATAGLGMAQTQSAAAYGLGMQQTAATQALGMEKAASAYDLGATRATAGYETAMRGAETTAGGQTALRQEDIMDKFYGQLAEYGDLNQKVYTTTEEYEKAKDDQFYWYDRLPD